VKLYELNEKQQGLIDEDDRKRLKIRLLSEKLVQAQAGREGKEHGIVLSWCRRNRIKCIHAPCTRKVKDLEPGFPDFMFYRGRRYLFVEMKVAQGYLSEDQKNFHQELRDQNDEVNITWSADETIRLLRGWLWEHFRWMPTQD
jgi:hypothetical protein